MLTSTEGLLANARKYQASFDKGDLALQPKLGLTVLACMDPRMNIFDIFGLKEGDAHVIRNAGGAATEDAMRSIVISQRMMGTKEIIVVHHTNCGMLTFKPEEFLREIEAEVGMRPTWAVEGFSDIRADVRQTVVRLKSNPFIPDRSNIRGFVYDVFSGSLSEVVVP